MVVVKKKIQFRIWVRWLSELEGLRGNLSSKLIHLKRGGGWKTIHDLGNGGGGAIMPI